MNPSLNGISLSGAVHSSNHSLYIPFIRGKLGDILMDRPDINYNDAAVEVLSLIKKVRTWIGNNQGTHIDNIAF